MSLSHEICADRNVGPDGELPVFASNVGAITVESITLVPTKTVEKHEVNFATFEFIDKGSDGKGNNIIASVDTNINNVKSVDFIANVKTSINVIPYLLAHALILKVTNNGTPIDLGWTLIIIRARR
jgi:hypothetical protein